MQAVATDLSGSRSSVHLTDGNPDPFLGSKFLGPHHSDKEYIGPLTVKLQYNSYYASAPATMPAPLSDVANLQIQAVIFACMCAVAGVYFTVFVVAILATFRRSERSFRTLRAVTIVLFILNAAHFIARSIEFNEARKIPQPVDAFYNWVTPLRVVENISTALTGAVSDGFLAFRFWVIFGKRRWALYIPAVAISLTALLGVGESLTDLAIYRHRGDFAYANVIDIDNLKSNAAWAWCMFATNTALTLSILIKIIQVTRASKAVSYVSGQTPYGVVVEAIIESALVTWIGLLFYEIASLAPQGHYTNNLDIGLVGICIVQFFFGISQCLITARLSLIGAPGTEETNLNITGVVFAQSHVTTIIDRAPRDAGFGSQTNSSDSTEIESEKDDVAKSPAGEQSV